jgi:hypothetical protein
MITKNILFVAASLIFASLVATGQSETPKGFTKGSILLTDSTVVSGYIKEKIRGNASLTLLDDENKKKIYDGSSLLSATIGDEKFCCIKGDFFRVIEDGAIKFMQKASDASYKPVYNGNQAVFINGTEGSPGDYFLYITSTRQLKHLNRKSVSTVVAESFGTCAQALVKAKVINEEISRLNEAVQVFNQCGTATN